MNRNDYSLMLGTALQHIVHRLSDEELEEIDDDLRLIELAIIHYIQLKFDGSEDNG